MKTGLSVAAVFGLLILIWAGVSRGRSHSESNQLVNASTPPGTPNPAVYLGLRNQILQSSRAQLGLATPASPQQPWGLVMDWGLATGSATVVALSDGTASVYLSSGGGYIGGQSHKEISDAAKKTVAEATKVRPQMHLTKAYPLPKVGDVSFLALTDSGTFTASASEDDLRKDRSSLANLGNAAQEIITQYRLLQDRK